MHEEDDMAVTTDYTVRGMTCQHCVRAVTEEVGALPGVTDVQVELDGGRLRVTSAGPVPAEGVRAAVDEAGYTVVAP